MTLLEKIEICKLTAWLITSDILLSDIPGNDTFEKNKNLQANHFAYDE